jgi:hypothetical protein
MRVTNVRAALIMEGQAIPRDRELDDLLYGFAASPAVVGELRQLLRAALDRAGPYVVVPEDDPDF